MADQAKPKAEKPEKKGDSMDEGDDKEVTDIRDPNVVTKYKKAAEISNQALQLVLKEAKAGKLIVDLCEMGDKYILEQTAKIYNNKVKGKDKIEKGLGFPTCISVNHVVGHFSPMAGNKDELKEGDLVKIDLGTYIDGYVAVVAHSFVVQAEGAEPVKGRQADVLMAAHKAADAALRLLKPGNKNYQITDAIAKIAADYKVNPVQGVLSHEMTRFVIDGEKVIIAKDDPEQKVEEVEFAPNQVWAIDIVMSTGEGKPKEVDERTTVYKRAVEQNYQLKMKASRYVLGEITKNFPTFPFTIRAFDEKKVRFGIVECYRHDLVHAYPVLQEKEGEFVAHFKFTAMVQANATTKITGLPFEQARVHSELSIQDQSIKDILNTATGANKKKKKNKGKKRPAEGGSAEGADKAAKMDTSS